MDMDTETYASTKRMTRSQTRAAAYPSLRATAEIVLPRLLGEVGYTHPHSVYQSGKRKTKTATSDIEDDRMSSDEADPTSTLASSSEDTDSEEDQYSSIGSLPGARGLYNLGSTCYMNASLQAISHCPPLSWYLRDCRPYSSHERATVTNELIHLVEHLWSSKQDAPFHPVHFVRATKEQHQQFDTYQQQDSQEFLNCILDDLNDDLPLAPRKSETSRSASVSQTTEAKTVIEDIFAGQLCAKVNCLECNNSSTMIERHDVLAVELALNPPEPEKASKTESSGWLNMLNSYSSILSLQNVLDTLSLGYWSGYDEMDSGEFSLDSCLEQYFEDEVLEEKNKYDCDKCKEKTNAIKSTCIVAPPKVLTIALKRFWVASYAPTFKVYKVNRHINFPLYGLNLQKYSSPPTDSFENKWKYHLVAIICHSGRAYAGHYFTLARNVIDGRWFKYDDTNVTEVDESDIQNYQAYVLFYQQGATPEKASANYVKVEDFVATEKHGTCWVSRRWWSLMLSTSHPGPIRCSDFLCEHGAVKVQLQESAVKANAIEVPRVIAEHFWKEFGGDRPVPTIEYCSKCTKALEDMNERRKRERELLYDHGDDKQLDTPHDQSSPLTTEAENEKIALSQDKVEQMSKKTYAISSAWYSAWIKFLDSDNLENSPPGPIDNKLLQEITSETQSQQAGADCKYVSQKLWSALHDLYGGGPEVFLQDNVAIDGSKPSFRKKKRRKKSASTKS